MKAIKYILSLAAAVAVFTSSLLTVSAQAREIGITVASVTAVPSDEIAVSVDVVKNTGVMAMAFAISYDNTVLEYIDFNVGVFNDYTVVDHPDKGYVSFVNCEKKDRTYTGNIMVLQFKVKDTAAAGEAPLKIINIRPEDYGESLEGCFATWGSLEVTPTVTNGSVTVGKTCANSGHTYGKWTVVSEPLCEVEGVKSRSCTACGHTETKKTEALGHEFESVWTVDTAATAEKSGLMSRHCKRCEKTTDSVSFELEIATEKKFENTEQATVAPEKWEKLEELTKANDTESSEAEGTGSADSVMADASAEESVSEDERETQGTDKTSKIKLSIIIGVTLLLLAVVITTAIILIKRLK